MNWYNHLAIFYLAVWIVLFVVTVCTLITLNKVSWKTLWNAFGINALWFISVPALIIGDVKEDYFGFWEN